MNRHHFRFLAAILFLFSLSVSVSAQDKEVFRQKGYILTFINQEQAFDPALRTRMIKTFFKVYPELCKAYNPAAVKEITFVIDTAYKGVAATSDARVAYSPVWFKKNPGDIDVVTHEVMHIVQAYGQSNGPWWVTEGIADYVRYKYGVDNVGAKWTLPAYQAGQNYDNGYRITARFLAWLEKNGNAGIVKTLDQHMRNHSYTEEIWKIKTGKTLADLWTAYTINPTL